MGIDDKPTTATMSRRFDCEVTGIDQALGFIVRVMDLNPDAEIAGFTCEYAITDDEDDENTYEVSVAIVEEVEL